MKLLINFFSFNLLLGACLAQLPEFHVIHTDMLEPMREFVVGNTLLLLSNQTDIEVTSEKLVSIMSTKYGNGWFYLLGTKASYKGLISQMNSTLQFQYKETRVTISQQQNGMICNNTTLLNLNKIIEQARISPVVEQNGLITNTTVYTELTSKAKLVLSPNYGNCDKTTRDSQLLNWCFRKMSIDMTRLIQNEKIGAKNIVVSVGFKAQFFSYGYEDCYLFSFGDIYFDIRIFK